MVKHQQHLQPPEPTPVDKDFEPKLKVFDEMHLFPEEEQTPPPETTPKVLAVLATLSPLAGTYVVTDEGNFWYCKTIKTKSTWFKEVEPNVFVMIDDADRVMVSAMRGFYMDNVYARKRKMINPHALASTGGFNSRRKYDFDEMMRLVKEEGLSIASAARKLGIARESAYRYSAHRKAMHLDQNQNSKPKDE